MRNIKKKLFQLAEKCYIQESKLSNSSYNLAIFYVLTEQKDNALKYLENCLNKNELSTEDIFQKNEWDTYKNDVDFKNLINKYSK